MPLLYAAATASQQMQVYIVGSLQFSKCLCGGGLVIIHVVCYSVTWSFYENICQFVGRKLRHYLSGCVCVFPLAIYNITFRDSEKDSIPPEHVAF